MKFGVRISVLATVMPIFLQFFFGAKDDFKR